MGKGFEPIMCHPDASSRSAIVVSLLQVIVILPASMIIGSLVAADAAARAAAPRPIRLEDATTDQRTDASASTTTRLATPPSQHASTTLATAASEPGKAIDSQPQTQSASYTVIFDSVEGSSADPQTVAEGTQASRRRHQDHSGHAHHTGDMLQQHSPGRRRWVPSHSLGRHLEGDHASTHARHGNCDHRLDAERGSPDPRHQQHVPVPLHQPGCTWLAETACHPCISRAARLRMCRSRQTPPAGDSQPTQIQTSLV